MHLKFVNIHCRCNFIQRAGDQNLSSPSLCLCSYAVLAVSFQQLPPLPVSHVPDPKVLPLGSVQPGPGKARLPGNGAAVQVHPSLVTHPDPAYLGRCLAEMGRRWLDPAGVSIRYIGKTQTP